MENGHLTKDCLSDQRRTYASSVKTFYRGEESQAVVRQPEQGDSQSVSAQLTPSADSIPVDPEVSSRLEDNKLPENVPIPEDNMSAAGDEKTEKEMEVVDEKIKRRRGEEISDSFMAIFPPNKVIRNSTVETANKFSVLDTDGEDSPLVIDEDEG